MPPNLAAEDEHAFGVYVVDKIPILVREVDGVIPALRAGVIDQDVDAIPVG
ncbi:hypothetical protein SDC9_158505 [bioreactor metagenome]|uniref:Uncharacterized protein n=1 Tax=bioreactor metagenome TaxID=1076179 RepID=A0A645FFC8_9ZZZZ